MKRINQLICTAALAFAFFCFSCNKENQPDQEDIITLDELESDVLLKQDVGLVSKVQAHLNEQKSISKATEIQDVKYYETSDSKFYLITYKLENGKSSAMVIRDNFLEQESIGIRCTGGCSDGCRIVGQIDMGGGGNTWSECSCSDCKMQVTVTSISENSSETLKSRYFDIEELAAKSYLKTFGKAGGRVAITKVEYQKDEKADIQTFTYEGADGIESTFMVITALADGVYANGIEMKAMDSVVIDCTGGCDCRERYYPTTGAAECTCDDCKMTVEQIT